MTWEDIKKNRDLLYFILGSFLSVIFFFFGWGITAHYADKAFEKWQLKVATATSQNIMLEQKACDATLQIINDKIDSLKNRNINDNGLSLEYLDNVKNQVVMLKNIVSNSKSFWDLMFPVYTKPEYAEDVRKVEDYDKQLLGIISDIKELNRKRDVEEKLGQTEKVKDTVTQLQEKIEQYRKQLDVYKNLPTSYPSSVASADSVATGSIILFNGNVFNPQFLQNNQEDYTSQIKTDKQSDQEEQVGPPNNWGK